MDWNQLREWLSAVEILRESLLPTAQRAQETISA